MSTLIESAVAAGWNEVASTPGYLSEREARFLMNALAVIPVSGANVEIGSFKGKSTVGLATVARLLKLEPIVAIDPHSSPASTDPELRGEVTSFDSFVANLKRSDAVSHVDIRREFSADVAMRWNAPIRMLWIDGDHTYEGAHADLVNFKPFLVPGGLVAMHDVLGTFEGCLRVFLEDVLQSRDFGPVGYSGSIGWAQYRPVDGNAAAYRIRRRLLSLPTARLTSLARHGRILQGRHEHAYRFWRALTPHGDVNARQLARRLAI